MHRHNHQPDYGRAFAIGVALNAGFVIVEAAYGFMSGSLALLADAGHNLGDVLALLLAWGAVVLARRGPSEKRTYGLRRTTILAAVISGLLMMLTVAAIVWEALRRLAEAAPVAGRTVIVVAAIGVAVNFLTAMLFHRGRHDDLNIRSAWLHMAADAAVSAGVVVAGFAILATGWLWLDPGISLVIAAVILIATWQLLRESVDLAVDAVPGHVDRDQVFDCLRSLPGVTAVHDLHIWAISTSETALTAHLVVPEGGGDSLLQEAAGRLAARFGIEHSTLQIERGNLGPGCDTCEPEPQKLAG